MKTGLHTPAHYHVMEDSGQSNHDGKIHYGGSQDWYRTLWQCRAGCGPTTCSGAMLYLSRSHGDLSPLAEEDAGTRTGFLRLMEEVWEYVTPTNMGVNSADIYTKGAVGYAQNRGVTLSPEVLEVSPVPFRRPTLTALEGFLDEAFSADRPVAFLNLSNGALKNLDNWHWVTLADYDGYSGQATMYDQGLKSTIDLALWLRTTTLGGAFVSLGA